MGKVACVCTILFATSLCAEVALAPDWVDLTVEHIVPMGDNIAAKMLAPGRFSLSADFSVLKEDRASWDFPIRVDMRKRSGITFDFLCSGAESISSFRIYLKSGNGWYSGYFDPPSEEGWHCMTVRKSAFTSTEGKVSGWGKVDMLRISAWRSGKGRVSLGIGGLSFPEVESPLVGVVRADTCMADPKYRAARKDFSASLSQTLCAMEGTGIPTIEMSDMELNEESVAGLKLLVFPYNPHLPNEAIHVVKDFVSGGGRLFACHTTDLEVRKIIGLDDNRYKGRNWWAMADTPTAERNGFYLSHVWRYPLEESERQAYDLLFRVEPNWKARLDAARKVKKMEAKKDAEWIATRPSKTGEWRAFWCHSARGLKDRNWDESIRLLKENGFNAILPNLAWGGTAFYRSNVLPMHSTVATEGDAFKDCIAACRKYGVECHVWKVCWKMGSQTEKKIVERYRSEGRLQKGKDGKELSWLCPSRPENLNQEIDAFVELAKMGPDGIHFDYIRYSNANHCFCDYCRRRFESGLGYPVVGWPEAVSDSSNGELKGKWRKFRCANITALVQGVAERVRREAPGVKLSAAVFHNHERNPDGIGQDWVNWCRDGLLDFVCPMDYYGNFNPVVSSQVQALKGFPVKLRPGIGLSCWSDARKDAVTATKQIEYVRRVGLDGFAVFNFGQRAAKVLPILHTGPTR